VIVVDDSHISPVPSLAPAAAIGGDVRDHTLTLMTPIGEDEVHD
jgi:hypothetical protein